MNVTSPDLTQFNYTAIIDLSTGTVTAPTPSITFTDTSIWTAGDPIEMIFNLYSPSNVLLHEGDFDSPDITAEGGSFNTPLLTFQNMVQWGVYKMEAWVRDSNGTVFKWTDPISGHDYKSINVCRIAGSEGQFPKASLLIQTDCENKRICISNQTPTIYQGVAGNVPSDITGYLVYPADPTSGATTNQPIAFLPSCFEITLNGRYQILFADEVQYDLPLDTGIIFKYSYNNDNYQVQCNLDLCAIYCDYAKLMDEAEAAAEGSAANEALVQKLAIISGKIIQFNEGKKCGVDVSKILAEIIEIGNFECNCNCQPTAIAQTPISDCPIIFSVVNECGDITGTLLQDGSNFQLTLADKTYVFAVTEDTTPFVTVTKSTDGCTSTFTLQFTSAMLDVIANSCHVRVNENDGCCDWLENKVYSSDRSVSIEAVLQDDECVKLDFTVTIPAIPGWINLALVNSFFNSDPAFQGAQYRKWTEGQNAGLVEIRGFIQKNDWQGGTEAFANIPTGLEPTLNQISSTSIIQSTSHSGTLRALASGTYEVQAEILTIGNATIPIEFSYYIA